MEPVASGDSWAIQLGDCLDHLPDLPDGSVDMLVTDPPYSSGGMFRGDRMGSTNEKYVVKRDPAMWRARADFAGDNRDARSFLAWCRLWMAQGLRVTRPGGILGVFTDWRQLPIVTDAVQAAGWIWRGVVVWDKSQAVRPQLGRYRAQAEFVVWASRGSMAHEGPVAPGVFRHVRSAADRQHATGKPVGLMSDLLVLCPPGGVVLDPFMGGGATGVAAIRRGLAFVGYEQVPEIFSLAARRLEAAAAGLPDEVPVAVDAVAV